MSLYYHTISTAQTDGIDSAAINQNFWLQNCLMTNSDGTLKNLGVPSYPLLTFGGDYGSTASDGMLYVDGKNVFSIAQAINAGGTQFNGSRIRVPMGYFQYVNNLTNAGVDFSSACDMTLSLQGAQTLDGVVCPDGNIAFEINITKELLNALQSLYWPDAFELVPSPFYSLTNSMSPINVTGGTIGVLYTFNQAFVNQSVIMSNVTAFISTGGSFTVTSNAPSMTSNTVTLSYTGVDVASSALLGCSYEYGTAGAYPAGSAATVTVANTAQYIAAGGFVAVNNTSTSTTTLNSDGSLSTPNNITYYAPYLSGGIGAWTTGEPLPEDGCGLVYAPSCTTLFAISPSGTLYAAGFPQDGTMGTWGGCSLQQLVDTAQLAFSLPAYNLTADDICPSISVVTLNSTDYLFIFGGVSGGVQQYTGYYSQLDSSGNIVDIFQCDNLPFATGQGLVTEFSGLSSFGANNCVYVRDTSDFNLLTLYSIPVWIDGAGSFNTGTWVNVISQYSSSLYTGNVSIIGIAYGSIITSTSVIGLTADGYGISDNIVTLPPYYFGPNAYQGIPNGVVFENSDGTSTILSSANYGCWLYQTTWIDIPLISAIDGRFLVLTFDGAARTNFGVNVNIQDNRVYIPSDDDNSPSLYYTYSEAVVLTPTGWKTVSSYTNGATTNAMLQFTLFADSQATYPNFTGIIEFSGHYFPPVSTKSFKFSVPNNLMLYSIEMEFGDWNTTSAVSLQFDGIGGINQQPGVILASIQEMA
jgi:hypothetical protein